jgi:hypothetical protein
MGGGQIQQKTAITSGADGGSGAEQERVSRSEIIDRIFRSMAGDV